jgi:rhomboid protease GluP
MFKRIIKPYLATFIVLFIGYSFLNWLLTTKTGLIKIDKDYLNFFIPFIITYIPIVFILRPIVNRFPLRSKIKDALLWVLLPFSISIPTIISQRYFKDISYQLVTINNPEEALLHPNERFFKIKTYHVNRGDFSLFKERHVSGIKGKTLKANNYYIAPLYSDSLNQKFKVAYGIKYATSINYGMLFRDKAPRKTKEFDIESEEDFSAHDFYNVAFFELQMDSEDNFNSYQLDSNNRTTFHLYLLQ